MASTKGKAPKIISFRDLQKKARIVKLVHSGGASARVSREEKSAGGDGVISREEMRMRSGAVDIERLASISDADLEDEAAAEGGALTYDANNTRMVRGGPPVRAIRAKTGLTQEAFAEKFGLRVRTLQQWEQGARFPSDGAAQYLMMIEHAPDVVARVVHDVREGTAANTEHA